MTGIHYDWQRTLTSTPFHAKVPLVPKSCKNEITCASSTLGAVLCTRAGVAPRAKPCAEIVSAAKDLHVLY
jgi:hypothetical protein